MPLCSSNLVIHYWFVCGHDTNVDVESVVRNESAVYGDILRLNYTESYSLLAFKTMSSLWLASVMDVRFIVKVDDDVYLHVPKMIWWLKTSSFPEKLYAGAVQDGVELKVISGAPARAKRARSGVPWVRKFGKLSIRENLVMT